jgi:outer membrane lipoprotein LolB
VYQAFFSVLLLALLSACSSLPSQPLNEQRQSALPSQWQLQGKLASKGLGAAVFNWQQQGRDSVITISAPLGAGAARIRYQDGRLSVQSGEQQLQNAEARQWLQANGLTVPLDALAAWVQGLPAAGMPFHRVPEADVFTQAGWKITVRKWQSQQCARLPSRLKVENGAGATLKLGGLRWRWQTESAPSLFKPQQTKACDV